MLPSDDSLTRLLKIREIEESLRGPIRVVLVNTPLDSYTPGSSPKYDTIFPFGLLILAEIAKSKGVSSLVIDGEAARLSVAEIASLIEDSAPVVVGLNLLSPTMNIAAEIAQEVARNGRIIIGGGPHATFEPHNCFEKIPQMDYLFRGEAVTSWTEFLRYLNHEIKLGVNSIQGVWSKDPSCRGIGKRTTELGDLPIIDRLATVFPSYQIGGRRETAIFASIGCAENCRYCAGRAFWGGIVRYRNVLSLVDEIESCVGMGIEAFHFADDNFIQCPEYVKAFTQELARRKLRIHWRSFARADDVSDEIMEYLIESGCYRLTLGIESGCPRTLANMGKGHTVDDSFQAIQRCRSAGVETKAFFMLGYPDETRDEIEMTIKFAVDSGLDWAYFYLVRAFPGTRLFKALIRQGFRKEELLEYVHWIPQINEGITEEQKQYRSLLENRSIFSVDSVLKYNVAHQRTINGLLCNEELTSIMSEGYRRFYFRKEFVARFL